MQKGLARSTPVLLAIAANANLLANGFVYDDGFIFQNLWVHSLRYIPDLFSHSILASLGEPSPFYRPVMALLAMTCYLLFGAHAWGYHLFSVLLHAFCTLQVFRAALLLTRGNTNGEANEEPAFWAAVLFAILPIHTESIAWYSALADPIFALFGLLAFIWYAQRRIALSLAAFLLAMLSKEPGIMILPLILAWELLQRRENPQEPAAATATFKRLAWFIVPLAVYSAMRLHALGGLGISAGATEMLTPASTVYSVFFLFGNYIRSLVYPFPFTLYHTFHPVTTPADWRFLGGAAAAVALAFAVWFFWRRRSRLWFAVIWIVVPLVPVLVFNRTSGDLFGERYLYLPSAGFCWLVGVLASRRREFRYGLIAFAAFGTVITVHRNAEFHDDITLWKSAVAAEPDSYRARASLATAYLVGRQIDLALPIYESLIPQATRDYGLRIGYGTALVAAGRLDEARAAFERAAALRPTAAEPWFNLGLLSETSHDVKSAERFYRRAVELNPASVSARENLGILLAGQKRWDEAADQFRAARSFANLEKVLALKTSSR